MSTMTTVDRAAKRTKEHLRKALWRKKRRELGLPLLSPRQQQAHNKSVQRHRDKNKNNPDFLEKQREYARRSMTKFREKQKQNMRSRNEQNETSYQSDNDLVDTDEFVNNDAVNGTMNLVDTDEDNDEADEEVVQERNEDDDDDDIVVECRNCHKQDLPKRVERKQKR